MTNNELTAADKFLVKNWAEAAVLEDSMKKLRKKHGAMLLNIGQEVVQAMRNRKGGDESNALDAVWEERAGNRSLVLTRKDWPANKYNFRSDLWMEYLDFDSVSEGGNEPSANLWLASQAKEGIDVRRLQQTLQNKLPNLFKSGNKCFEMYGDEDPGYVLGWPFSSNPEILRWILNGDGQKLKQRMAKHVATFTKMVPVINQMLRRK